MSSVAFVTKAEGRFTLQKKPLAELKIGELGIVESIDPKLAIRDRLMEMGLITNTKVQLLRFAPLGDPIEILLRGYHLSIRKEEAQYIQVRLLRK